MTNSISDRLWQKEGFDGKPVNTGIYHLNNRSKLPLKPWCGRFFQWQIWQILGVTDLADFWSDRSRQISRNCQICHKRQISPMADLADIWIDKLWQIPRVTDLRRFVEWQFVADICHPWINSLCDRFLQWQIWQILGMADCGRLLEWQILVDFGSGSWGRDSLTDNLCEYFTCNLRQLIQSNKCHSPHYHGPRLSIRPS